MNGASSDSRSCPRCCSCAYSAARRASGKDSRKLGRDVARAIVITCPAHAAGNGLITARSHVRTPDVLERTRASDQGPSGCESRANAGPLGHTPPPTEPVMTYDVFISDPPPQEGVLPNGEQKAFSPL